MCHIICVILCVSHVWDVSRKAHLYVCMTHWYVKLDWFIYETRSLACGTWRIHICDMTHIYMRPDLFICETWIIHIRDTTYLYMRHDSFMGIIIWHLSDVSHTCDTHHTIHIISYDTWYRVIWHIWLWVIWYRVIWHIWLWDTESYDTYISYDSVTMYHMTYAHT